MVEIGNHTVGHTEIVGREDELVGPSVIFLQQSVGTYGGLRGTGRADANGTDVMSAALGFVDNVAGLSVDDHLLRAHLVLGQVFHLNALEIA